jgi:hypothetical protein
MDARWSRAKAASIGGLVVNSDQAGSLPQMSGPYDANLGSNVTLEVTWCGSSTVRDVSMSENF